MIYYFSKKDFPVHKKQAALQEIFNFVQIEEESHPQARGRLLQLLNAMSDAYHDTTSLPDNTVPLGEFLDEHLARVRENEITETDVAHLTKLNDIATLFTNDEKTRQYYILKLFLFSLKGDAKI